MRKLVEEIIVAQQAEIISMRNRLKILPAASDANPEVFPLSAGHAGRMQAHRPRRH
jgi:hypothetical protein